MGEPDGNVNVLEPGTSALSNIDAKVKLFPSGEKLDVIANPRRHTCYTAMLAFVPAPLRLKQALPVTIMWWTDDVVEAHFSDALLYGAGDDEVEALENLRENIVDAWVLLSKTPEANMARPARRMWHALMAVCEEGQAG